MQSYVRKGGVNYINKNEGINAIWRDIDKSKLKTDPNDCTFELLPVAAFPLPFFTSQNNLFCAINNIKQSHCCSQQVSQNLFCTVTGKPYCVVY